MTIVACPHGCGGTVDTAKDDYCRSCRRGINEVQVPLPSWCWAWWGPASHRMRCRKKAGHRGEHSTHSDCGARGGPERSICGLAEEHEGPHAWEIEPSNVAHPEVKP